jgi:hypothetical protein
MRRVIRRHIRRRTDGLDLAMDLNAVIAVNSGGSQREVVSSHAEASADTRGTQPTRPAGPTREAQSAEPERGQSPSQEEG